jgi:hypothetical protein
MSRILNFLTGITVIRGNPLRYPQMTLKRQLSCLDGTAFTGPNVRPIAI